MQRCAELAAQRTAAESDKRTAELALSRAELEAGNLKQVRCLGQQALAACVLLPCTRTLPAAACPLPR
jgi:hypothetical protein